LKVCIAGSKKPYPAFDSVSFILKEIFGQKQVTELRITDGLSDCPSPPKIFLSVLQDLMLYLNIVSRYGKQKIDIVVLFQGYYPLTSVALRLLKVKSLLFIGGSGFYWSYLDKTSAVGKVFAYANLPIEKICHKFADALITVSPRMVTMIGIEKYEHKTWFALPRLDRGFFRQFGIKENYEHRGNVVGYVGSLCRGKGILNLMRAIPLIIKRKNDCEFLIVGGGPFLETIKGEAQRLQVSKSTRITGFVDCESLKELYNEMRLCVLPSYAEGMPSTIFEAMACGTPVLASPVGGIPDVIRESDTGFLLTSNDPEYIAEKITQLLDNPQLMRKVSSNAYMYLSEHFSEKRILESWRKIFEDFQNE
jgi:glycosyltransferase involved in cell wall biosynthesis